MCRWMFGLWDTRRHATVPRKQAHQSLVHVRSGKVVKRIHLRRSPRRNKRPEPMPGAVIEHLQFTIVPGELELRVIKGPSRLPKDDDQRRFVSVDSWFHYPDLKLYHGPSNIVHILKFVEIIQANSLGEKRMLSLVIRTDSDQALNGLLLTAAYMFLLYRLSPPEIAAQLSAIVGLLRIQSYKTEGEPMEDDFLISILDCLGGLERFLQLGLLDLTAIDIDETLMREHPLNGDMNWIVPGKILALAGPTAEVYEIGEFGQYALRHTVQAVVRLNRSHYDRQALVQLGIQHHEMFMPDGGIPAWEQIEEFFRIADELWEGGGAIAVHCRAGLGRTGTMIATFLIRKFGLQARHVIAYLRMMRPGSILSRQARFLDSVQYALRGEQTPESCVQYLKEFYAEKYYKILAFDSSCSEHSFSDHS